MKDSNKKMLKFLILAVTLGTTLTTPIHAAERETSETSRTPSRQKLRINCPDAPQKSTQTKIITEDEKKPIPFLLPSNDEEAIVADQ